ncbi:M96 mating-specific protein family [Phytophthora cinnamomi]|uniref:M96 mating-specific protein family n=1 Tax=Phytophthora cinnamomi TaxID=4785 RepID=UPI003559E0AC|nr:M96 mating-specific protein family [Phytophthora cinnamomi]
MSSQEHESAVPAAAPPSLDEGPAIASPGTVPPSSDMASLPPLDDEEWDPKALLDALVSDIAFVATLATSSANGPAAAPNSQPKRTKRSTRPKRNYDPNKARTEKLCELRRLRAEADGLELKLQKLQTNRSAVSCPLEHENGHPSNVELPKVWQDICARQLERRLKVELENSRLRDKCRAQFKLAKSVEKLLFRRLSLQNSESETGKHVRRVEIPAGFIQHVAERIFDELAAGVDVSYREVERVLETNCPVPGGIETHWPLIREGVSMELYDRRTLPFDLHAVGDAWWRRWHNYRGQRSDETVGDDVVRERYGLEMVDVKTGRCATFYVQQVLRRYVESNRVVIVWHSYFEPFTFDEELVRGMHFLLKGYVLMKPQSSDGANADGEAVTRVLTCYHLTPLISDPEIRQDASTIALTKFMTSATSANISTSNEMMENILVDQALQKCC